MKFRHKLQTFLLLFLGAALFVRLGPKDRWVATGLLYYASPWILIAVGFAVLAVIARRRVMWIPALLCAGLWIVEVRGPGAEVPLPGDRHLRLWSAMSPKAGFDELTDKLLEGDPWLVLLTESWHYGKWAEGERQAELPKGYRARYAPGGFTVLTSRNLRVRASRVIDFGHHSRCVIFDLQEGEDEPFALMLLDLNSNPLRAKEQWIAHVMEAVHSHSLPVRIIAGDFNLPPDSVWLNNMRGYRSAFRERGHGLDVSWPMPLPLLGLDQLWGDETVEFRASEWGASMGSDHRKLDVWLRL